MEKPGGKPSGKIVGDIMGVHSGGKQTGTIVQNPPAANQTKSLK